MKVKCIKTNDYENIKVNNIYDVLIEERKYYAISNDTQEITGYEKELFEIVKEPKFKIGDKVTLINGKKFKDYYGEELEYLIITGFDGEYYKTGTSYMWLDKELKLYEEVDKMEKTFKEIVLDNKVGEVWKSYAKTITILENGLLSIRDEACFENEMSFCPENKYKLQRNKYTFSEAFAAYEEGKDIESCISGETLRKGQREGFSWVLKKDGLYWEEYKEYKISIEISSIKGSWYINV